jgi:hypothetical protein
MVLSDTSKVLVAVAVAIAGCGEGASPRTPGAATWTTPEAVWRDAPEVRARVACAARALYGPAHADALGRARVYVHGVDYPFRGLWYGGGIHLRSDVGSAGASPWRHEAVHALLDLSTGDAHAEHDATYQAHEVAFTQAYRACALASHQTHQDALQSIATPPR